MKEDSPQAKSELLMQLSKEVSRIAGALAQLSIGAERPITQNYPFSNQNELEVPVERLEWLIRNRTQLTLEILKRLSELVVATDSGRPSLSAS